MSWSGVKKQSIKADIEAWCDEMGIYWYTINSKGEIDVDGSVDLNGIDIKELPYKFGTVNGYFDIGGNTNLTSLKNCPDYVHGWFSCDYCKKLDSLDGCPKEVRGDFYCSKCKREFTIQEVNSLCKAERNIIV